MMILGYYDEYSVGFFVSSKGQILAKDQEGALGGRAIYKDLGGEWGDYSQNTQ